MISSNKGRVPVVNLETKRKPAKRRRIRLRKASLPFFLAALLVGYAIFAVGSQFGRFYSMERDLRDLQYQVENLKKENAALEEKIKQAQSQTYVEKQAREKLGLVKPGEKVILPEPHNTSIKD